jgi:hypothetical protein
LAPVAGRDVVLADAAADDLPGQLAGLGARVTRVDGAGPSAFAAATASADVLIGAWSAFQGASPTELAEAERILRPGGRLLVAHDYGRDDVSTLRGPGDWPAYDRWSQRTGPFLGNGFRIRVIHCWLTFDSIEDATTFMTGAFGERGVEAASRLTRPRLSYNVAIYHRTFGTTAP